MRAIEERKRSAMFFDNVVDSKPIARMCFAEQADTSLQTGEDDGGDTLSQ